MSANKMWRTIRFPPESQSEDRWPKVLAPQCGVGYRSADDWVCLPGNLAVLARSAGRLPANFACQLQHRQPRCSALREYMALAAQFKAESRWSCDERGKPCRSGKLFAYL